VKRRSPQAPPTGVLTVVLSYALFAALWIVLSDTVVALLFRDPVMISRVSTLKGWLFVAVTSALLFGLMQRLTRTSSGASLPPEKGKSLALPLGLLVAAVLVLTGGVVVDRYREARELEEARFKLIADLKTRQVVDWLSERERDARYVASNPYFAENYRLWRSSGRDDDRDRLTARLDEFRKIASFQGVALLDERGRMLWNSLGKKREPDPGLLAAARQAVAARQVRRHGPYLDAAGGLHLDFIAPMTPAADQSPIVVLHADPEVSLFRHVEEWPAPSASAEILLFRRDGEQVLYLTRLRHLPDAALKLRLPLSTPRLLAARVLHGEIRVGELTEGVDYRGVAIQGVVRAVPGTDWFLLVKMDSSELFAEASSDALWVGLAGLLGLFAALTGAFLFTQRQQLASALREQQTQAEKLRALKLLEAVSEGSGDAVFAKDAQGRYLLFNKETARVTGKLQAEVLGKDDRALFPPAEAEMLMATGRRVLAENRTVTNEEVLTTTEGTRVFLATKGPLHDESGAVVGLFGISRDITERKQAELALQQSEERLRLALQAANQGLYDLNVQTGEAVVSPEYATMLGYDPAVFRETNAAWIERLHPDDVEPTSGVYRDYVAGRLPEYRVEFRQRTQGGAWKWILSIGRIVERDAQGRPLRMLGTHTDITERKAAEQERERLQAQLVQAQKMESVGRLAGGVAHDFNNMLFVILGHVSMALESVDPAQPVHGDLVAIRTAAQRSADITRQLLAFARRQTVAPRVVDLNGIVTAMLSMLRRLIGEDIDLVWLPHDALWPVKVDPAQIDQILANLCVNARDAIEGVGKVTIETDNVAFDADYCADHPGVAPGEYVRLAVSDDGCGMDGEVQAHLFEPFFTPKEAGRGTGLGLATVYGIVKQNDGAVNVYSEPGQGTTFRIYLRRAAAEPVGLCAGPAAAPPEGHGELILLVEDEASILELGEDMLKRLGYSVLAAGTPEAALRLAREHGDAIRLLITDVVMPSMNGRELAERLQAGIPGLGCLYMSGYTANVIAHHGVLDQGIRFIQKPFSAQELGWKVHEVLVPSAASGAAHPRVLYVDDEPPLLELIRRYLERHGCVVTGFSDPAAALAEFRRDPNAFDFAVTDLAMPGLNGFELTRELLAARPGLPVVMTSGYVTPADELTAQGLGALALIPKASTVDDLGCVLERLIRERLAAR
jgi:PAS domain S-box-containing protein